MDTQEKNKIINILDELERSSSSLNEFQAKQKYMDVLSQLLSEEGYQFSLREGSNNIVDAVAYIPSAEHNVKIQFKYYKPERPVPISTIREDVTTSSLQNFHRLLLVSNTRFTPNVRDQIAHDLPLRVELIDLDSLRAWAVRLDAYQDDIGTEVRIVMQNLSRKLAEMIAKNPAALNEIEWRDLERIIAEVFSALGFDAILTPGSKDGGKDVILECEISNEKRSYIVEIKHWRSGARVGHGAVDDFLHVITRENRNGGLFLSTYGYCDNAFEYLAQIERQKLRFGSEDKVVGLCHSYIKAKAGIWSPPQIMEDILFEGTE